MIFENPVTATLLSVTAVSLISLIGVTALSLGDKILQKIILFLVSFSVGAMFGDVFYHLLPEIIESGPLGFTTRTATIILIGILTFFILEKFLHWQHTHSSHGKDHHHDKKCIETYAKVNLYGDALHNFIDGAIIAGSYLTSIPLGIATTTAVILHEIPQEFGDFGVLLHGGFTKIKAITMNFLSAITAIVGAVFVLAIGAQDSRLTMTIIPFTIGGFLYIAGSDLLPELRKEPAVWKTIVQFIAIILGITVMRALLLIE